MVENIVERCEWSSPIAIIIVTVVRPLRSNHVSEYLGPRTWNIGWDIADKNWMHEMDPNGQRVNNMEENKERLRTCPKMSRA